MLAGYSILVVDDDDDNRHLVSEVLALARAQVTEAPSADLAYDLVSRTEFDVVISDISMPGGDGWALLRRLAETSATVPLAIALSGHGRAEDRARSLEAGFDSHLVKPIMPGELVAHVRARLDHRERP